MDDRKRSFEEAGGSQSKRLRPDEILGATDDSRRATTRLLVNKTEFSKIIGKQGQTLHQIRLNSGVNVKASDVDEEMRVVVLTGTPRQVLDSFDTIAELLRQTHGLLHQTSEPFDVEFLIEPTKVGKIVGIKGATINSIKLKCGLNQLRVQKDPLDVNGVSLQPLKLEGGLQSIRRCHFHLLELYCDVSGLAPAESFLTPSLSSRPQLFNSSESLFSRAYNPPPLIVQSYSAPAPQLGKLESNSVIFSSLTSYGVLPETVHQLMEMKAYLSRHFGLDLCIFQEVREEPLLTRREFASSSISPFVVPIKEREADFHRRNPNDIIFNIPKETVGAVIGKGGSGLKELQAEFGYRIHLEKDESGITRNVVISAPSHGTITPQDLLAMQKCRDRIFKVVESVLENVESSQRHLDE